MALNAPEIVVVATYHESEWSRWRYSTVDGPDFFAPSFKTWDNQQKQRIQSQTRTGLQVFRVRITVEDFLNWAKRNGRSTDSTARHEYAALHQSQNYYV